METGKPVELLNWFAEVLEMDRKAKSEPNTTRRSVAYFLRNRAILKAFSFAIDMGIHCGIRIDPEDPEWPVVFFQLPTGQVSFHIPEFETPWDLHTPEQAAERLTDYLRQWGRTIETP